MSSRAYAWAATLVVLGSVLTAWADPAAGHFWNAAALALVTCWFITQGLGGGTHWVLIPILSLCAWGLLQLGLDGTVYRYETWNATTNWLARAALFYMGLATLKDRRTRESVLSAILWCGAVVCLVGTIQWFTSNGKVLWMIPTQYQDEVLGTFLNRDHYAVFVELIVPIALTRALERVSSRFVYVVIVALFYASVVGTGARAGTIFLTLEIVVVLAMALAQDRRSFRTAMAVAAGMAVFSLAAGWQYVWFRIRLADPFAFRRELALATLHMIRARPLTGFGLGTWPVAYPAFAVFDPPGFFMNHAHNDWLEWLAEGGIPILCALLPLVYAALKLARRNWWALGIPVCLLHAGIDFPMQKPALAALAFFLFGAAASASGTEKNS